ncbi:uncharacterized protein [Haliotis asinina]|uniref:uncharacterized protein n=1 Tax=Haliotis asinina TaxID=109174 RepID=UPI003531AC11
MYVAVGGGGAFIIVFILGAVCLLRRKHGHGHSVKEEHPVINSGNINTALQLYSSEEDDIMVENDLYERSSDVVSPATQDLRKADDTQVEGYTVKESPPAIGDGNGHPTFQQDSSDDDIMVENDLYERSSDVVNQSTHYLENTDGVSDGEANKANKTLPDPAPVIASADTGDDLP